MKSFFMNLLIRILIQVIGSGWFIRNFAKRRMAPTWQSCLQDAGRRCGIPSEFTTILSQAPIFLRLMINTFRVERPIPSAQDIAVSLAFLLRELEAEGELKPSLTTSQIRGFSVALRQSWLQAIHSNHLLRAYFKDVRDTSPAEALNRDCSCEPDFDAVLSSPTALGEAYFASFATPDASHYIHVWLPDAEHIVHYDEQRHVVKVAVNAARGCDLGFYQTSHDYSLSDQAYAQRLFAGFEDAEELSECGKYDGELMIGRRIGEPLWLR